MHMGSATHASTEPGLAGSTALKLQAVRQMLDVLSHMQFASDAQVNAVLYLREQWPTHDPDVESHTQFKFVLHSDREPTYWHCWLQTLSLESQVHVASPWQLDSEGRCPQAIVQLPVRDSLQSLRVEQSAPAKAHWLVQVAVDPSHWHDVEVSQSVLLFVTRQSSRHILLRASHLHSVSDSHAGRAVYLRLQVSAHT